MAVKVQPQQSLLQVIVELKWQRPQPRRYEGVTPIPIRAATLGLQIKRIRDCPAEIVGGAGVDGFHQGCMNLPQLDPSKTAL